MLERAWNSLETNQFGTNEFIDWCKLVGTEPLLGLQPRHRHAGAGRRLRRVLQRRQGHEVERAAARSTATTQPHAVKYWCLGNEMDGPWQMGHMTAREYGRKARDAARQIRVLDPSCS